MGVGHEQWSTLVICQRETIYTSFGGWVMYREYSLCLSQLIFLSLHLFLFDSLCIRDTEGGSFFPPQPRARDWEGLSSSAARRRGFGACLLPCPFVRSYPCGPGICRSRAVVVVVIPTARFSPRPVMLLSVEFY